MSDRAGEALEDVVKKHGEAQLSMYEQASEFSKKLLAQISEEDEVRLTTYREGIRETADKIALVADSWKTDSTNLVTAFQSERTSYIESLKAAGEDSASRMEANSKQSHEAVSEIASTMTSTCGTIAAEAVGRLEDAYNKQINDWSKSAEIATRQNNAAQQTLEILESRLAPMAESIQTLHAETVATLSSAGASADGIAKVPALFDDLIGKYAEGMDLLSVEAAKMSNTVNSLGRDAEGVFHTTGEQLGQISVQLNQVIKLGQNSGYETKPSWVKKLGNWTRQKFTRSKQS